MHQCEPLPATTRAEFVPDSLRMLHSFVPFGFERLVVDVTIIVHELPLHDLLLEFLFYAVLLVQQLVSQYFAPFGVQVLVDERGPLPFPTALY